MSELKTVSMFGDQRIVLIEDADDFVSANRPALEKYATSPAKGSLLILDVKSFPKRQNCSSLSISTAWPWNVQNSRVPICSNGCSEWQKISTGSRWIARTAALIVQLAGDGLGMLLQEVAKLASLVGEDTEITRDDIVRIVGGWRTETTWVMLDAVRDGNAGQGP